MRSRNEGQECEYTFFVMGHDWRNCAWIYAQGLRAVGEVETRYEMEKRSGDVRVVRGRAESGKEGQNYKIAESVQHKMSDLGHGKTCSPSLIEVLSVEHLLSKPRLPQKPRPASPTELQNLLYFISSILRLSLASIPHIFPEPHLFS